MSQNKFINKSFIIIINSFNRLQQIENEKIWTFYTSRKFTPKLSELKEKNINKLKPDSTGEDSSLAEKNKSSLAQGQKNRLGFGRTTWMIRILSAKFGFINRQEGTLRTSLLRKPVSTKPNPMPFRLKSLQIFEIFNPHKLERNFYDYSVVRKQVIFLPDMSSGTFCQQSWDRKTVRVAYFVNTYFVRDCLFSKILDF